MSEPQEASLPKMDPGALWREELFTDRKIGAIRKLTPVKADGSPDMSRKAIWMGEASLMTPAGSLPLSFEIQADGLDQAVAGFGDSLEKALAEAMEELKELRRRTASQIVIPQGGLPPGGLGAGGLNPGGLHPGGGLGGKLKLP